LKETKRKSLAMLDWQVTMMKRMQLCLSLAYKVNKYYVTPSLLQRR